MPPEASRRARSPCRTTSWSSSRKTRMGGASVMLPFYTGPRARRRSTGEEHRRAVAEEPLVGGDADLRPLHLPALRLPAQLPHQLAHLGDRLGRHCLAEAREATRRVDRDPAAARGVAGPQQHLRLAALAKPDVPDP